MTACDRFGNAASGSWCVHHAMTREACRKNQITDLIVRANNGGARRVHAPLAE
jgi:hypothetical protein